MRLDLTDRYYIRTDDDPKQYCLCELAGHTSRREKVLGYYPTLEWLARGLARLLPHLIDRQTASLDVLVQEHRAAEKRLLRALTAWNENEHPRSLR